MKRNITFFFMLLLTSCLSQSSGLVLGNATCAAPCWYGLTPGKTTVAQAEAVLRSLPFVSSGSIKTNTSFGVTDISWVFGDKVAGVGILTFSTQGIASEIRLNPRGLQLGEVIDAFGAPERIWVAHLPSNDGTMLYQMLLFYPSLGITVRVIGEPNNVSGNNMERIVRDLQVDQIQFYQSMSIEAFLTSIAQHSKENVQYYLDRLQPWPGFGEDVIQIKP
jgi:hypothetical protein